MEDLLHRRGDGHGALRYDFDFRSAPIYVDDISLIGKLQRLVDSEGAALTGFTAFLRMLGVFVKEIKDRAAAQV